MPRPLDFDALMESFLDHMRRKNPTARTHLTYRTAIVEFGNWLGTLPDEALVSRQAKGRRGAIVVVPAAVVETGDITSDHLGCHVAYLQQRDQLPGGRHGSVDRSGLKLSPNTVNNRFRALQSFIKWMGEQGEFVDGNQPLAHQSSPALIDNPKRVLTLDQMTALVATCGTGRRREFRAIRDEAILRIFFEAGGRRSEVATAQLDWLNLDGAKLHVDGRYVKTNVGKDIPLGQKTIRVCTKYRIERARHPHRDRPDLWLAQKGAFTPGGIYQMVRERGEMIGIAGLHPHMFRHTFANVFLDQGGTEDELKQLGGWQSDKQVRHYSRARATQRAHATHARLAIGDLI